MKTYTKPELDVIEIKASDVFTDSGAFDLGEEDML